MTTTEAAAARYVGTRVHRVEDARLLLGRGTFVDDVVTSREWRTPASSAVPSRVPRIRRHRCLCSAGTPRRPGGVHRRRPQPGVHEQWYTSMGKDIPDTPRPPLADGEARFVGDPVALVVAVDAYVAEDAVDLVDVDYEPAPAGGRLQRGPGASRRSCTRDYRGERRGCTRRRRQRRPRSDIRSGCARHRADDRQQAYAPVPMETRGMIAEWSGEELTVWAATQAPHEVRHVPRSLARHRRTPGSSHHA